jgi:predicted SAM-dependent methyltransferase
MSETVLTDGTNSPLGSLKRALVGVIGRERANRLSAPYHDRAARRRTARTLASLRSARDLRVNIGCGPNALAGWINLDAARGERIDVVWDLRRGMPFADGSCAAVFGEHVIEHVLESTGRALLSELHRVLRPGGVLRLATPDLVKLIAIYEDRSPEVDRETFADYLDEITGKRHERACQVLNDELRLWGHQYVYDEEDLSAKLREAGFTRIERVEAGESTHAALRGLESHSGPDWLNRATVMCLEATR